MIAIPAEPEYQPAKLDVHPPFIFPLAESLNSYERSALLLPSLA